jgi:hypothetical protein
MKFIAVLAVPVVLYTAQAAFLWSFSIDDAGISFRYAAHLAEGGGFVWNVDGPRVEGYSNFLWVLILAAGRWVGFNIEIFAKILGFILGIFNLTLLAVICKKLWFPKAFWWLPVPQWLRSHPNGPPGR